MTSITKFKNRKTGERLWIKADFAQASSPISISWDKVEWFGTPFQVADARHRHLEAAKMVVKWGK
tara:strand:- start:277 stop:471 length:195 start_codon:yes stop_codon:yes gene_type:complete